MWASKHVRPYWGYNVLGVRVSLQQFMEAEAHYSQCVQCPPSDSVDVKLQQQQGMSVNQTTLYQDNMSSMLLKANGWLSSTKHTKHMGICCFFYCRMLKEEIIYHTTSSYGGNAQIFLHRTATGQTGSSLIKLHDCIMGGPLIEDSELPP